MPQLQDLQENLLRKASRAAFPRPCRARPAKGWWWWLRDGVSRQSFREGWRSTDGTPDHQSRLGAAGSAGLSPPSPIRLFALRQNSGGCCWKHWSMRKSGGWASLQPYFSDTLERCGSAGKESWCQPPGEPLMWWHSVPMSSKFVPNFQSRVKILVRCPGERVNFAAQVVYVVLGIFLTVETGWFSQRSCRADSCLWIPPVLCLLLGTISNPHWKKFIGKHYKKWQS